MPSVPLHCPSQRYAKKKNVGLPDLVPILVPKKLLEHIPIKYVYFVMANIAPITFRRWRSGKASPNLSKLSDVERVIAAAEMKRAS